ncbi:MAG: hypothetical protein ACREC0_00050 [Methylocella sp.]
MNTKLYRATFEGMAKFPGPHELGLAEKIGLHIKPDEPPQGRLELRA